MFSLTTVYASAQAYQPRNSIHSCLFSKEITTPAILVKDVKFGITDLEIELIVNMLNHSTNEIFKRIAAELLFSQIILREMSN